MTRRQDQATPRVRAHLLFILWSLCQPANLVPEVLLHFIYKTKTSYQSLTYMKALALFGNILPG